ncbi:type II secretion system inner membrane protein GspF [Geobacter pelophilus]|uniref:General secretion pathway protein F n=1 Tax=Geoanaerobacter pelophilus TaxID=60036 RepID=A0AAW4L633_9BACT|nr:type II secretion system inner membrane protein GspF [Geoanaerobacter pelophilus]MBT0664030.1 type II secretion system inner membrane protein GspF [Geoanaerobacter pelophilus]
MPTYRYNAYKAGGAVKTGTIEADTPREARLRLKNMGLFAKEITPAEEISAGASRWRMRKGVPQPELALATRRLATLLASSVPVYEAISALQEQERPGELRNIFGRIRERIKEGSGLAKALTPESHVFSDSYIAMVSAGEASGALEKVLDRLADFLEDQATIRSRVSTALAYPILMAVVGSGVMLFLLAFVVPKIVTVFEQNRATLPLITIALLVVSHFLQKWWWTLVIAACGLALGYDRMKGKPEFRRRLDHLWLKLPLVGPLLRKLALARFGRVLSLLLSSGVPVIKALEISAEVVANYAFREALDKVKAEIIEGRQLSTSLAQSPLFPPLLIHMIAVGERGGELEQMLNRAGSAFEKEFETSVTRGMALLEPLLVLAMGLAVGTVVVAVLLPIFQLNQLIK